MHHFVEMCEVFAIMNLFTRSQAIFLNVQKRKHYANYASKCTIDTLQQYWCRSKNVYLSEFRLRDAISVISVTYPCSLLFLEGAGWNIRQCVHLSYTGCCVQSYEFCMSTLWVYLFNSTALEVESLFKKKNNWSHLYRGTNKHPLRYRNTPMCISYVYQCICGIIHISNLNLSLKNIDCKWGKD